MRKCQCDCGRYRNSDVLVCAGLLIASKVLAAHTGVCAPGSQTGFPVPSMSAWASARDITFEECIDNLDLRERDESPESVAGSRQVLSSHSS